MWIGSQHPEEPFVFIGQCATAFYFLFFVLFVPAIGFIENTFIDLATETDSLFVSESQQTSPSVLLSGSKHPKNIY